MSEPYISINDTVLKAKIAEQAAKITELEAMIVQIIDEQMPDDIKLKLKDVLTWILSKL